MQVSPSDGATLSCEHACGDSKRVRNNQEATQYGQDLIALAILIQDMAAITLEPEKGRLDSANCNFPAPWTR